MPLSSLTQLRRKSARGIQAAAFILNRQLDRFDEKLFVLGDGRSGTTWLANLLNFDSRYRVMFEPFLAQNFRPAISYQSEYPFPDAESGDSVDTHIRKVLQGNYVSGLVNVHPPKFLYSGLMIKDISSQLILDQICDLAPTMKGVMILRHPFAVASSKSRTFSWPSDPMSFLSADNPRRGEIERFGEIMENVVASQDPLLIQVLLWCLVHWYVFSSRAIHAFALVFYEDLVLNPQEELPRLFGDLELDSRYTENRHKVEQKLSQESHVTFRNNVIAASKDRQALWHDQWESATIDAGLNILEHFGFSGVYSDGFSPQINIDQVLPFFAQAIGGKPKDHE